MHNDTVRLAYHMVAIFCAVASFLALRYGFAHFEKKEAEEAAWRESGVRIRKARKK